jgi:hypothetical protein
VERRNTSLKLGNSEVIVSLDQVDQVLGLGLAERGGGRGKRG